MSAIGYSLLQEGSLLVWGLFPLLGLTTRNVLHWRVPIEGLAHWLVTFPDLNPGDIQRWTSNSAVRERERVETEEVVYDKRIMLPV